MRWYAQRVKSLAGKQLRRLSRYLNQIINFLDNHYTWLVVLVVSFVGCSTIFILSYFNRYRFFDWWNWKSRAVREIFVFEFILIAIRILLQGGV